MISISDVFFLRLANSFPEIFHFHLQKVQNADYARLVAYIITFYNL